MSIEFARLSPFFLFILILMIIMLVLCFLVEIMATRRDERVLEDGLQLEEDMTPTSAHQMAALLRTKDRLMTLNHFPTENVQLNDYIEHEFYIFARFVKRLKMLKESPEPELIYNDLDQLICDMDTHANQFKCSGYARREILHLCQKLPEQTLQKYDNFFVRSVP